MPIGIRRPVLGYLTWSAVKLAGYSTFARVTSRVYERPGLSSFAVGGVRTLIGMLAGAAFVPLARTLAPWMGDAATFGCLVLLLLFRVLEWWLLVWLFYDRRLTTPRLDWRIVAIGTVVSFLLDIPAAMGWLLTAGLWIC